MNNKKKKYRSRTDHHVRIQAILFSGFLLFSAVGMIATAFTSAGPMVLGTEMNANGMVEYMCLGNGCENMQDFQWSDKVIRTEQ